MVPASLSALIRISMLGLGSINVGSVTLKNRNLSNASLALLQKQPQELLNIFQNRVKFSRLLVQITDSHKLYKVPESIPLSAPLYWKRRRSICRINFLLKPEGFMTNSSHRTTLQESVRGLIQLDEGKLPHSLLKNTKGPIALPDKLPKKHFFVAVQTVDDKIHQPADLRENQ